LTGCAGDASTDRLPKSVAQILDKAGEFELYSLKPEKVASDKNSLRGWKVLGKTVIKKGEAHTKVLTALNNTIGNGGAKCFDPRHGIRAAHDGKTVELLICFECEWVYVYIDGKAEGEPLSLVNRSAEAVFDRVLRDAGVPLAPKPRKD
jgi:hypothetical protein